jgi:hypothetical protein
MVLGSLERFIYKSVITQKNEKLLCELYLKKM